jgi:hypothetical protein
MRYFPQLATGAGGQFPIRRRAVRRTVVNACPDGRTVKLGDPGSSSVEWELALSGLTGEEWADLEALFEAVEGRLGSFGYLDPLDNLLKWSEDLNQVAWEKGAGLELTPGIADPLGTTRATRITNSGGAAATIQQALEAPGGYQYCVSVWARSTEAGEVRLLRSSENGPAKKTFKTWGAWSRLVYSTKLEDASETVSFGLELDAGGMVEVFGFQVEAQAGASGYKKTTSRGGVYPEAYFMEDALKLTSEGPGEHSGVVRIRARR